MGKPHLELVGPPVDTLKDEQLDARAAELASKLSPRVVRFVSEYVSGTTMPEAARRAGLSTASGKPYVVAARPGVAELVRILREQYRRRAALTAVGAITRFQHLSRRAEDLGDLGVAVSADREAAKIAGLYPDNVVVAGGAGPVNVTVALNLPQRLTPPSFLTVNAIPSALLPLAGSRELTQAEEITPLHVESDPVDVCRDVSSDVDPLS